MTTITLRSAGATTIILRSVAVAAAVAGTTIYLTAASPATALVMRSPVTAPSGGGFPPQYSGLRYFHGSVKELSLVALADAPAGMGGQWRIRKGGVDYAVYLVETTDPNASAVRIRTSTGTKAARLKT